MMLSCALAHMYVQGAKEECFWVWGGGGGGGGGFAEIHRFLSNWTCTWNGILPKALAVTCMAAKQSIPCGLQEFLKYCGVRKSSERATQIRLQSPYSH